MINAPEAIRYHRTERMLELVWDGVPSRIGARDLRIDCRCAACVNEFTGERILDVDSVAMDIGVRDLKLVGSYALKAVFEDGHDLGLFTWEHLAQLAGRT